MVAPYFVPSADLLPYWPHDLLAPSDVPLLGRVSQYLGVSDLDIVEYDGFVALTGTLAIRGELELGIPMLDGVSLVVGQVGDGITELPFELRFGGTTVPDFNAGPMDVAENLLLKGRPGPYELRLPQFDLGIRFDKKHLKAMIPNDAADLTKGFKPDPADRPVQITFRTHLVIDTDGNFNVESPGDLDLGFCQIGSTGVVIAAQDVVVRLSSLQPFPEGIDPADFDLDPDWKGVYLGRGFIFNLQTLWDALPTQLDLEKWFIGSGGVTGKATAVFDLTPDMTNQDFAVRSLRLALHQNSLLEALVQAAAKLSFWNDRVIYLDLAITNNPELDFPASVGFLGTVGAEQPENTPAPGEGELLPPLTLSLGDTQLLRVGIKKLGVRSLPDPARAADQEKAPDTRFWDILIDGRADVLPGAGVSDAVLGAEVKELAFQVAPDFKPLLPQGLWVNTSEELLAKLGAFPISVSRVGYGKEGVETWIGLDARIAFGTGLGVGAAVKGLRVYFGGPAGKHIEFDGIELHLSKRPAFSFDGYLSMSSGTDPMSDATNRIFRGNIVLMIAGGVGVKLDGSLMFGTKAGTRFGYFALDATFGRGLPISTGVSWFGGALMVGVNVAPNRALSGELGDSFNWYQHWYAPGPGPYSVTHPAKWIPQEDAWAVGAGVSIGSTDGKAWSLKALLAVMAPGPVIMIEGRARLLKEAEPHGGPPSDSAIRGLVVLDFEHGEFLLGLEVDYKIPESGLLLDVHSSGEIFYATRPRDWHVALGWPEPLSRRIRAKALRLLSCDGYLVVSGRDLVLAERTFAGTAMAVGYRFGIEMRGKWGPIRGVLALWLAADAALSFKPFYILAQVNLHGEASIKIFGIGFELMLDALLALEAPVNGDDLFFGGAVTIKVGLPWPLPDVKKNIPISWGDESGMPPPITPLIDGASVTPGYTSVGQALYGPELGIDPSVVLPLDGRIVITFQRGMRSTWPGAPTPGDLAAPGLVGDRYYRYTLTAVRARVTPAAGAIHDAPAEELFGQWTLGDGDAVGPTAEALVLFGTSPFVAAGNLAWPGRNERRSWVDLLLDTYPTWPCGTKPPEERCVAFGLIPVGVYDPKLVYRPDHHFASITFLPWPDAVVIEGMQQPWGDWVQLPLAIVPPGGEHKHPGACLRLARTTLIGGTKGRDLGFGSVSDGTTVWGVSIDLPPSRRAHGRVVHNADLYLMGVSAFLDQTLVANVVANNAEFVIESDPQAFNRLVIQIWPRNPGHPARAVEFCLSSFCYTTLGMLEAADDFHVGKGHWLHVLDPLVVDGTETEGDLFGAHLVHEPFARYDLELDVRTESAESLDGTWEDLGIVTETLSVPTGGAPTELEPYVHDLAPGDGARPVYADYDLRIAYNQPYVEAMYRKAGEGLFAELFNSAGAKVEPQIVHGHSQQPMLSPETAILVDQLSEGNCVPVDPSAFPGTDLTIYRTRLASSTPYQVMIRGGNHPTPVYTWSFVTSRYRNFRDHVAAFRQLPWHERLADGVNWPAVAAVFGAANRDGEEAGWLKVWGDVWDFPVRTPPERPDVTLHWQETGGLEARAISLAGPEPLFASERTQCVLTRQKKQLVIHPDWTKSIVITWVPVATRWIRALDGARSIAIPVDSAGEPTALSGGTYRLEFTYRLTGIPGLMDLSRQSDTSDETASWTFVVPATPDAIVDPEA